MWQPGVFLLYFPANILELINIPSLKRFYLLRIIAFFLYLLDTFETPAYALGLSKRKNKVIGDLEYRATYRGTTKTRHSGLFETDTSRKDFDR